MCHIRSNNNCINRIHARSLRIVYKDETSIFNRDEIEPAFRFMAQGKHIGKVVIQVRNSDMREEDRLLTALYISVARS